AQILGERGGNRYEAAACGCSTEPAAACFGCQLERRGAMLSSTSPVVMRVLTRAAAPVRRLLRSGSGNVAITFGLLTPVLFMSAPAAVDYGLFDRERARLQNQVDAAAIASARELQMARADAGKVSAVAESMVHSGVPAASVTTQVNVQ